MSEPECDLTLKDCQNGADYRITIDGSDDPTLLDEIVRDCCSAHKGWYQQEFGQRGYDVDFEPLE